MADPEKSIPNPSSSLIYFFVITIIYIIFKVTIIYSKNTPEDIENEHNNNVWNGIYVLLVLIGSYFINLNVTKAICNTSDVQWMSTFFITILPWVIIFGMIFILLKIFPGWVSPFSNTIGYWVIKLLGVEDALKTKANGPDDVLTAINNINKDKSKIINEISSKHDEFESFIKNLKSTIENTPENKLELFRLITIKKMIGEVVWYILAGTLISAITYNFILNMSCTASLEHTKRTYRDILSKSNDNTLKDVQNTFEQF